MPAIESFVKDNGIITDIEKIIDILDESTQVFLLDTCFISLHELVFNRHGEILLKHFTGENTPIILTESVLTEMLADGEDDGRYGAYLRNFPVVLALKESDFYYLVNSLYNTSEAKGRFRKYSHRAFSTIQSLAEAITKVDSPNIPDQIVDLFDKTFDSGKNKGEYSLLWLSVILEETTPNLKIFMCGLDRDLYRLVDHCHIRSIENIERHLGKNTEVKILSTETMIQACFITGMLIENVAKLCDIYRNVERRILYQEILRGIRSDNIKEAPFQNEDFVKRILESLIEVLY